MHKLMMFSLSALAGVMLAGCSTLSEWYDTQLLKRRAAKEAEFKRLADSPPAQVVKSPRKEIAIRAHESCDLFNVAQPKMKAYIALTENSYEYRGYINDVQYYIEEEKMSSAEAQKKVRDAVIAGDASRPDDEKIWPKIVKGAEAARQFGSEAEWKLFLALRLQQIEINAKVVKICKAFYDRQKELKKLVKKKQISKEQMQQENSVILERLAECAAIQRQLSDAGKCIAYMVEQHNRVMEFEREAAR